jgi:hypothetical protein
MNAVALASSQRVVVLTSRLRSRPLNEQNALIASIHALGLSLCHEAGEDIGNEVHEEVPDHVGDEIFAPNVEGGQDCSCDECDQDVGPASGPMGDGEDDKR